MLDLTKFSKRWLPKKNAYLIRIEEENSIMYALVNKTCTKYKLVKLINKDTLRCISRKV